MTTMHDTAMTAQPARPRFTLTLEAGPDPLRREPHVRLRQLLKLALRGMGFRCIEYRDAPATAPTGPTESGPTFTEQS